MGLHPVIREDAANVAEALGPLAAALARKTLLLTGGGGFLGRTIIHAIEHLNANVLEQPCRVLVLDNFITGLRDFASESKHVTVVQHDVTTPFSTDRPIDFIMHAAGIASPVFYNLHRIQTLDVGTLGTRNMLELARDKRVQSFLLFSSSEIYGDPDPRWIPTPETYAGYVSCTGPRACYDESKRVAETYAVNYYEQHRVPAKIVRPFNIYGPGMRLDDRRVVPNFVLAALKGQKIPVHGDGSHTRSFCYVSDAVAGFLQVLLSPFNAEAFNVGNDSNEVTTQMLADAIAELFANSVPVGRVLAPNDAYARADPKRRCPDLRKIATFARYQARVDLLAGLKRFIAWAKDQDISAMESASP
jgi:UDP-glucuronate decarboxylase